MSRKPFKAFVLPKKEASFIPVLAEALEAAANGIVLTDIEGIVLWVNPAYTSLTGYVFEEIVGKSTRLLNSGKQGKLFYQNLWQTILSGRMWHGELINRKKDGSLYTEEQTITPVKDESGKIIRFIAIKQDVTKRKKLEEELVSRNIDFVERRETQNETTQAILNVLEYLEEARGLIE